MFVCLYKQTQTNSFGVGAVLAELDAKFQRRREHVLAEFTSRVDGIRAAHKLALRLGSREAELAELPAAPPSMARTTSLEDSERIVSEATIVRDAQLAEIQKQHGTQLCAWPACCYC